MLVKTVPEIDLCIIIIIIWITILGDGFLILNNIIISVGFLKFIRLHKTDSISKSDNIMQIDILLKI